MRIGHDKAHPDIPAARPLDPPRSEDAAGIAVNQQRSINRGWYCGLPPACAFVRKAPAVPDHRRHDEMRDVAFRSGGSRNGRKRSNENVRHHFHIR
jgi:hypothetical protein